jgi:hypothetical protein
MQSKVSIACVSYVLLLLSAAVLHAQDTQPVMWYQGVLLDKQSRPKPDAKYNFVFQVFDEKGVLLGQPLIRDSLDVVNGTFGVGIPLSTFDENRSGNYWLQVTVNGEVLTPRIRIGAVPYALRAKYADGSNVSVVSPLDTIRRAEGGIEIQLNQNYSSLTPGLNITKSPDGKSVTISLDSVSVAALFSPQGATEGDVIRYTTAGWAAGPAPGDAPVGTVIAYAGTKLPGKGKWMVCDGQEIPIAGYGALYDVIKETYGPSRGGNFFLPDYRGQFLRMADKTPDRGHKGVDPDGQTRTVGSEQGDAFQGHSHATNLKSYPCLGGGDPANQTLFRPDAPVPGSYQLHNFDGIIKHPSFSAPRTADETRSKNIAVYYLIKVLP